jgi:peptidoglycan/LPS O-acetylase OafA/YrhL
MSLFFVLSGFVIQYNYGPRFTADGEAKASRSFLLARFARLYPLYFFGLILSVSFVPNSAFFSAAVGCSCVSDIDAIVV